MKKLTLIKVPQATTQSLDFWKQRFEDGVSPDELEQCGVKTEEFEFDENDGLTMIKVGDKNHIPTPEDLETWRKVFEEAQADPDFKIFTNGPVNIEHIQTSLNSDFIIMGDYRCGKIGKQNE